MKFFDMAYFGEKVKCELIDSLSVENLCFMTLGFFDALF